MSTNRITTLLGVRYPIIQGGMVWCSGWRLAAAVSHAGGLGLIGAGSMYPDVLRAHVRQCKAATDQPFGVNVPLLYPDIDKVMNILVEEGVKIVFTSAGNPTTWTSFLKEKGIKVVHVISSVRFAKKSQEAGVDAVVAEGFEAGGHNGREETTTFCLVPMVRQAIHIPLIAAGGVASGRAMLAAFALGAEGVQVGTRFAACSESSAHDAFKQSIVEAGEGDTVLTMKQLTPVRLLKNKFCAQIMKEEYAGASKVQLAELLGRGRAKKGMFEGNLQEGELEMGQIAAVVRAIQPVAAVVREIWEEYCAVRQSLLEQP